jgi:hypothetical protein
LTYGIVTINYLRPLVLRLWLASMDRLRSQFGNFPVVCVSPIMDKVICEKHNVCHIEHKNDPVSDKWNVGFLKMKELGVDYILPLDSDDIMSNEYMANAIAAMEQAPDLVYTRSIYFYSAMKDYIGNLYLLTHSSSLGQGKCIHKSVLEKLDWIPYKQGIGFGMNGALARAMRPFVIKGIEIKGPITDVKTRTNLNSIRVWARKIEQTTPSEVFLGYLSQPELDLLERIKKS